MNALYLLHLPGYAKVIFPLLIQVAYLIVQGFPYVLPSEPHCGLYSLVQNGMQFGPKARKMEKRFDFPIIQVNKCSVYLHAISNHDDDNDH